MFSDVETLFPSHNSSVLSTLNPPTVCEELGRIFPQLLFFLESKVIKPKLNFLLFLIRKRDWSLCKRESSTLILSLFVYTCVTMDKFKSL